MLNKFNLPIALKSYRFVVFILLLFLWACTNDLEEVKEVTSEKFVSIEKGEDVSILFTEDAVPTIKIEGPTAIRYAYLPPDTPYTEFPDGLKLYVYDQEGKIESTLSANKGTMGDNSDNLEVTGDVQIVNSKGEKLNAEKLFWNKTDKKIRSDEFVKIYTNDEVIYGTGFEADENFTNYVIYNIKGVVKVRDGSF
ncbi:MAG: LPS export ABC transporter periplasmic protein LptC [Chitinophagales bacterium]|nr:LPS export ABC transporter periplasmic protein LptC [Bacteroidota bacterium]MCB9226599.1 LPS export ABC transporter periplasmic protein LptC [Chitinophagales bacterium]